MIMQRLAQILTTAAPTGFRWHYDNMSDEKHSTIYHPAALKAFRALFKPVTVQTSVTPDSVAPKQFCPTHSCL